MSRSLWFYKIWQHYVMQDNPPAIQDEFLCYQTGQAVSPLALLSGLPLPEVEVEEILLWPPFQKAVGLRWASGVDADFLLALQQAHDDAALHPDFHRRMTGYLQEIAGSYDIELPCHQYFAAHPESWPAISRPVAAIPLSLT